MGVWIFETLAYSLGATLVLELLFTFVAGVRNKKDIALVVLVNVLTNPFVVSMFYVNYCYFRWNQVLVIAVLEVGAVVAEGFCYKWYGNKIKHPFLLSIGANVFSYFTGLLLSMI